MHHLLKHGKIPRQSYEEVVFGILENSICPIVYVGKTRQVCEISGHPDLYLVVASNRISSFDLVLPGLIEYKGAVLTALTVFWLTEVLSEFDNHLVAGGRDIDKYLPTSLQHSPYLHRQALVVRKVEIAPIEAIIRGYLVGSGWKSYQKIGEICGHKLPEGLEKGDRLDPPIFTPTTKEESGHDQAVDVTEVNKRYPWMEPRALNVYRTGSAYALDRGIVVVDTKFEFGNDGMLADEVLTPDSSRFWNKKALDEALEKGQLPPSLDKQPVRDWAASQGIDKLDMSQEEDIRTLIATKIPRDVAQATTERYLGIFQSLTGMTLQEFQIKKMGIKPPPR